MLFTSRKRQTTISTSKHLYNYVKTVGDTRRIKCKKSACKVFIIINNNDKMVSCIKHNHGQVRGELIGLGTFIKGLTRASETAERNKE